MPRLQLPSNRSPGLSLIFKDYAMNQMKGTFDSSTTPNNLRLSWLTKALRYTQEEAEESLERLHISTIERLGSLDDMIMGGLVDQPLTEIDIKNETILMVSWHWDKCCDGELDMEQLDHF
ncbi:uncharacterized protein N7525_002895 [Penicillium rubens]|jgi:hypothetical protein|uniref:uncharacterized protein n=1 Tax=Penicillium rubens TaxID=1108849 RepID=UPI00239567C3|nr:uncharacterized protein N7525_002895 [Penicillium rubens]KAJ5259206.1 hypothetical protein N7524_010762 [Penicillium chrysogenum]KAJ5262229.1 hypothetical protein N7524_007534 [Penicillium chrysogenum]KAJ5837707.1 hypothetical protein N7525_002895 [Penicillium rubens]